MHQGVRGFTDYRFAMALFLYFMACALFFETRLEWQSLNIALPAMIAFIATSTLAWDFRLMGPPDRPACLVLQAAFFAACFLFVNRVCPVSSDSIGLPGIPGVKLLDQALAYAAGFTLVGHLNALSAWVLNSLYCVFMLLLVMAAMIFRKAYASVIFFLIMLAFAVLSVSFDGFGLPTLYLALGMAAMLAGFWLQNEDGSAAFWNMAAERLGGTAPRPRVETRIKIDLLRRLLAESRLYEMDIRGVVAKNLRCPSDDPRVAGVAAHLLDQLEHQDGLAVTRVAGTGKYLARRRAGEGSAFFGDVAKVVRSLIVVFFMVLYILSPIDLIPDAIPVFGVLDDSVVGIIGMTTLFRLYGSGVAEETKK